MTEMTPLAKAARTIAGLYNNARPRGMGFLHFVEGKLSPEDAIGLARRGRDQGRGNRYSMDYVQGRAVKASVNCATGNASDVSLFDDIYGQGAAVLAIEDGLTDPFYAELDEVAE
jgi:hypothetical protein